jgi:hypothetical protein
MTKSTEALQHEIETLRTQLQVQEMRFRAFERLELEHAAMLDELMHMQARPSKAAAAKNRAHWLKTFGVTDLPAAIRRAAYFSAPRPGSTGPWVTIASMYRPPLAKRPLYQTTMVTLLARLKSGEEGEAAARLWESVPVQEIAALIDVKAWATALAE